MREVGREEEGYGVQAGGQVAWQAGRREKRGKKCARGLPCCCHGKRVDTRLENPRKDNYLIFIP